MDQYRAVIANCKRFFREVGKPTESARSCAGAPLLDRSGRDSLEKTLAGSSRPARFSIVNAAPDRSYLNGQDHTAMEYQLVVIRGRSASTAVKLPDGVTTAGRQEDCRLRIKSSQVSRKHCQLFEKNGLLLVKDLGSSNGTFVNGKKINGQQVMEPGDELGIGPIVFRVEKIGQPAPSKAVAAPGSKKPSDTAIVDAIAVTDAAPDEEEFEIDFDDEPIVAEPARAVAEPIENAPPAPASTPAADPGFKPSPGLAASTKPAPPKPTVPIEPAPKEEPVADDAIADFLMGIKLEDDD